MHIILQGGPAHDEMIFNVKPGFEVFRYPLPVAPEDLLKPDPDLSRPSYDVALYRFSGLAYVTIYGEVGAIIYKYEGMEKK